MTIALFILAFPWVLFETFRWELKERRARRAWPRSVGEAVRRLRPKADGRALSHETAYAFAVHEHCGLGLYVRNEFGLWQGNEALLSDCGERDPDLASGSILIALHEAVHAESVGDYATPSGEVRT
jgi:hypothetical protein